MPSYLVTGSSRGLGLGFVTELLKGKDNVVIATARNTAASTGLQELKGKHRDGQLHLIDLDVTNIESIQRAAQETSRLLPGGLDNLISNAGYSDIKEFIDEVNFNLTATLLLLREFIPLVRKSVAKRVLVISSVLGSTELGASMPNLQNAYSTAKAALNMMVRKWSAVLKDQGITTVLLHPGYSAFTEVGNGIEEWMKTYAPNVPRQTIEECAESSMKVLAGITPKDNGLFYNYDGTKLPW
ncbi:short chain dehydrogenase domain-containing protein [Trichoderma breve]|uniref:Short chain dehydrogenase domain-containing protein n=1 Tax=Trichoderma breve TaxID=2034170 RepID=A0A9W9B7U4_9HYPO|nr:short chain dehydrogenase domain-containing protein [Trichoderma breve]KAJ4854926.1 short chain dehydrogenase domain-containing protein [Trichoderma breve]